MGNSQGRGLVSEQDFISLETSGDEWVKSQNAKIAKEEAKIVADAISQPRNKRKIKQAVDLVNRLLAGYQQRCAAMEPAVKKSIDEVTEIRKSLSKASYGAIMRRELEKIDAKLDTETAQAYFRATVGLPIIEFLNRRRMIFVFNFHGMPTKSVSDYRQQIDTLLEFYKRILSNNPKSQFELLMTFDYSDDLDNFTPQLRDSLRVLGEIIRSLEYSVPRCGYLIEKLIEEGSDAPPEQFPNKLDLPEGLMVDEEDEDSIRRAIACIISRSEQNVRDCNGCIIEDNSALHREIIRENLYEEIANRDLSTLGMNYVHVRDEALRLIDEYQRSYKLYFDSLERSSIDVNKLIAQRNEMAGKLKDTPLRGADSLKDLESSRQHYEKLMKKVIDQYNKSVERWARMEYLSRVLAGVSSGSPGFDPSALQLDQSIMSKQIDSDPFRNQDRALPINGSGEGVTTVASMLVVALLVVMMLGLIYYMVQLMAGAIAVAAGHSEKVAPPLWCQAVALSIFVVGGGAAALVMRWRSRAGKGSQSAPLL